MQPDEPDIDDAVEQTFPASDPPSHSAPMTAGPAPDCPDASPIKVWRVVPAAEAEHALSVNEDPKPGRWSGADSTLIYVSDSPAGALLEFLAHCEGRPEGAVALVRGRFPADLAQDAGPLPDDWQAHPYRPEVQTIGNEWAKEKRSYALRVPSALVPSASNYLLSASHVDAVHLQGREVQTLQLDDRLIG